MDDPLREPVRLVDPDAAWPAQYAAEERRIATVLQGLRPVIEHIGSTSVPLRGKPIIDIQVGVAGADVAHAVAALRAAGYEHHGEGVVPGREWFTGRSTARPPFNLHLFASGNPVLDDNRMIRDYLRTHPDAADDYVRAKQRALDDGATDLRSYSDAKGGHVAALREAARRHE